MDRRIKHNLIKGNFGYISAIINKGYKFNNQMVCDGFLEDNKLSEKELAFLTSLKGIWSKSGIRCIPIKQARKIRI